MTNSRNLVKKDTKCKFRWKKSETSEKSHKNVNKGDKNSQTCKKKTQKCKFTWKNSRTSKKTTKIKI